MLLDVQVRVSYHDYLITYDHCLAPCLQAFNCAEPWVMVHADVQNPSSHRIEHAQDGVYKQPLLYLPVEVQAK